jgi:hypothetical protein
MLYPPLADLSFLLTLRLRFLVFRVHGLVELHVFPQVLKVLLELFDTGDGDVVLSLGLTVIFAGSLCIGGDELVKAREVHILVDEHVVDLADLFLEFVN